MKFTQRSIPYRLGLALSTAFYRLGLKKKKKKKKKEKPTFREKF